MNRFPIRAVRWIAAGLGALAVWSTGPADAATSALDVGDQAVVVVFVRGKGNTIAVRTWDRPTVQIESGDDAIPSIERRAIAFGTPAAPLDLQVPALMYTLHENGQPAGTGTLAPEEFPYASFRNGTHDWVRIIGTEGSHLTITVPASLGVLTLRVGGGTTTIDGYRGANLVLFQGGGRVQLGGTTTTAFVQMAYGVFYAADTTFDRIRLRGVGSHVVFEHCRAKQIEASSVTGSIVYDGGAFDPGLARFESQSGNIALGVTAPAQLAGRSQDGHVYALFERRGGYVVDQRADGDATATVGTGGPLVNAISGKGNVFLYDGTLLARKGVAAEWRAVHHLFTTHRRGPATTTVAPPAAPVPHAHPPGGREVGRSGERRTAISP